jgi:hypothetical protein
MVPALPFFGMHTSTTAPQVSASILLAALVIRSWRDADWWVGPSLGAVTGALLMSGRSAWPMLPVMLALPLGRLVTAGGSPPAYWSGWATALGTVVTAVGVLGREGVAAGAVGRWAVIGATLAIAILVALAGRRWEPAAAAWFARVMAQPAPGLTVQIVLSLTSGILIATIAASAFVDLPQLPHVSALSRPDTGDYLGQAVATAATFSRFGHHDLLLSLAFWSGFGWLETLVQPELVTSLVIAAGLMLALTLVQTAAMPDRRAGLWLAVFGAAWWTSFASYAISTLIYSPDLHGRYLIGLYLCGLAVCWNGLASLGRGRGWLARTTGITLLTAVALVHAWAARAVVLRYF